MTTAQMWSPRIFTDVANASPAEFAYFEENERTWKLPTSSRVC